MTTRPISEVIASLRRLEFRDDSDIGILLDYAQEASAEIQLAAANAAACMRVANERHEELKLAREALAWALCSRAIDPPAHLRATIESVMGEKR